MQFSGSLEDVSIIDVLQILSLTGKDGRLVIQAPERSAQVTFRAGRVTAASRSPQKTYMTNRLLSKKQISFETLHEALQRQRELPAGQPRPIGSILVELGAITPEQLRQALHGHIQEVINEVAGWTTGTFSFELGVTAPGDGFGVHPADLDAPPEVNLQELLLEAARVYDEARHAATRGSPEEPEDPALRSLGEAEASVVLVTDDLLVQYGVETARDLPPVATVPSLSGLEQLMSSRGRPPDLVVLDLDLGGVQNGKSASLVELVLPLASRSSPGGVLTFGRVVPPWLLEVMATSVGLEHVPRPSPTTFRDPGVARCFVEALLARMRRGCGLRNDVHVCEEEEAHPQLSRLYRSILGLRSSRHSMTVSLELLRYVAEELERAVLLMVHESQLVALGVFGVPGASDRRDSSLHGRLRVPLHPDSILAQVVRDQQLVHHCLDGATEDPSLAVLFEQIGLPARPEAFLVPLVVRNRTFAVVYTDNGTNPGRLGPGEAVGVLAEHGSQLLENLLLSRQAERRASLAKIPSGTPGARGATVEPATKVEHHDDAARQ